MASTPAVEFDRVTYAYGTGADELVALEDVSFALAPGTSAALIGPSGCGKSTMLHMAAGLAAPTRGAVRIGGLPVGEPRTTTAYIPQNLGLFPWKNVYDNAALGLVLRHVDKAEVRRRTERALEEVGLSAFAHAYPKALSGGMKQRLAIARALALDADLMLMDEPLSAIDALLRESLQETLLGLWKRRGHTQIMVTHSIDEAVYLGQRIIVLSSRPGTVVADIDNPGVGTAGFRQSAEFNACARQVRQALAQGHAQAGQVGA